MTQLSDLICISRMVLADPKEWVNVDAELSVPGQ